MTPNIPDTQDPAVLEREVVRAQNEIGETVEKLTEKLNPSEVARAAVGHDRAEIAREALEVTKQSPIPVALIAIGTVWLFATSRAPMIRRVRERLIGNARKDRSGLRRRSAEPAPIGPSSAIGESYDRRSQRGSP